MITPEQIERVKELLPTSLGSAEVRAQVAADILRRSVFSARMASAPYLAKIRDVCAEISAGRVNQAEARARLLEQLARLGYDAAGEPTLDNPASQRRLDLIIDTQRQMAASVARLANETDDTLELYPAWELTRFGSPYAPRKDWPERWRAAGESVGWTGASPDIHTGSGLGVSFVALKDSPIWQALGDGAGGYKDTLGNPYPPFAYGSYMDWTDVDRATCERLGLLAPDAPAPRAQAVPSLSPDDAELLAAARRVGWPGMFDDFA